MSLPESFIKGIRTDLNEWASTYPDKELADNVVDAIVENLKGKASKINFLDNVYQAIESTDPRAVGTYNKADVETALTAAKAVACTSAPKYWD